MRNLIEVIEQTKKAMPPEVLQTVVERFDTIISSCRYASPETVPLCWEEYSDVVNALIGPPPLSEGWKIAVLAVYMNDTPESIKQQYGA